MRNVARATAGSRTMAATFGRWGMRRSRTPSSFDDDARRSSASARHGHPRVGINHHNDYRTLCQRRERLFTRFVEMTGRGDAVPYWGASIHRLLVHHLLHGAGRDAVSGHGIHADSPSVGGLLVHVADVPVASVVYNSSGGWDFFVTVSLPALIGSTFGSRVFTYRHTAGSTALSLLLPQVVDLPGVAAQATSAGTGAYAEVFTFSSF